MESSCFILLKAAMKHIVFYIFALMTVSVFSQENGQKAQLKAAKNANNLVFEANDLIGKDDFISAEMAYRQAISEAPTEAIGSFNLGTAHIKQGNNEEALYQLQKTLKTTTSKPEKHQIFHNIGNVLMANKKCKEAVEAFKNALRNNPTDDESRYNLALAKDCAKQQEDQNQDDNKDQDKEDENKDEEKEQDKDKDKDKDKDGNQDGNQDDQKDQGDQDKKEGDDDTDEDGKPKDDEQDKGKENQDPGKNKEEQQQSPPPQPGQMSPQQMKNLLEAMNNQEAKVQEKMNAQKEKGVKVQTEKDW